MILFFFMILFEISVQVPKSRLSILQLNDGAVMGPGVLADLEVFNYDILVRDYIGNDNIAGLSIKLMYIIIRFKDEKKR